MKSLSAAASLSPSRIQETTTGQESSDDCRGSQSRSTNPRRENRRRISGRLFLVSHGPSRWLSNYYLDLESESIGPWSNNGREHYPRQIQNRPEARRSEWDQGPIAFRSRRYVIVFVKPVRVIMNLKTALPEAARYGALGFKSKLLPVRVYHDSLAQVVWVKKAGLDDTHDLCERNRGGGAHPAAV